ncbi:MAG: hypothetical protein ACE5E6_06720 [Phycisphaerae bacterium]
MSARCRRTAYAGVMMFEAIVAAILLFGALFFGTIAGLVATV